MNVYYKPTLGWALFHAEHREYDAEKTEVARTLRKFKF